MKRIAAVFTCLLLLCAAAAAAALGEDGEPAAFPLLGITWAAPDSFGDTLGVIADPMEFAPMPGLLIGVIAYLPRTQDEAALYRALLQSDEAPGEEERAFLESYYAGSVELLTLIGVDGGMTAEDALAMLYPSASPFDRIVPVGESDGYAFTAVTYDYDDPYFSRALAALPEGMEADLRSVAEWLAVRQEDFTFGAAYAAE